MRNKLFILGLFIVASSCIGKKKSSGIENQSNKNSNIIVSNILDGKLTGEVKCEDITHHFELPKIIGDDPLSLKIQSELSSLMVQDLIAVTYLQGTSFDKVFDIFLSQKKRTLCSTTDLNVTNSEVLSTAESDAYLSYEILYKENDSLKLLSSVYRKEDQEKLSINSIVIKGKENEFYKALLDLASSSKPSFTFTSNEDYMNAFRLFGEYQISGNDLKSVQFSIKERREEKLLIALLPLAFPNQKNEILQVILDKNFIAKYMQLGFTI